MKLICQQTFQATCLLRGLCQSHRKAIVTLKLAATSSSCLRSLMDMFIGTQMVSSPFLDEFVHMICH